MIGLGVVLGSALAQVPIDPLRVVVGVLPGGDAILLAIIPAMLGASLATVASLRRQALR